MHLVILGTKMGAILKQEVETRADNIEVSAFTSVGDFIKTMAFRSIPQDELYRMWVCEDILSGDESQDLETLEKLYAFLDLNYRTTKVICITKQPYGYKVCSDVFKSTLNVTVCVNSLNGEMLKCLLTKPLDVVVKTCGGKKNDKKISKAIKKAEQNKIKESKKKPEKKKGGFSLFKKDKKKKSEQTIVKTDSNLQNENKENIENANINTVSNFENQVSVEKNIGSDIEDSNTQNIHIESTEEHINTKNEYMDSTELLNFVSENTSFEPGDMRVNEEKLDAFENVFTDNVSFVGDSNAFTVAKEGSNVDASENIVALKYGEEEKLDGFEEENNHDIENISGLDPILDLDIDGSDSLSVDLKDVKEGLEGLSSGLTDLTVELPNSMPEVANTDNMPNYNLLGMSETYGKATEKVVERVVEKVVEKHIGSADDGYKNSTDSVIATGRGVLVVTGDRRSGKSELVHSLAMKHIKNRKILVVDFAQGISGLAIKFGLDNILNFEENRQGGLKYLNGSVDVEHLIVRGGNVSYPLLLNIEDDKVGLEDVESKIEKLLFKTAFDLILVDMPIEYLAGLNKLIPHKNMGILVCVEGNATGVINTGILLDTVGLDEVYSSVLQDKVLYLQTRGKRELIEVFKEVKQWFDCEGWLDSEKILKL